MRSLARLLCSVLAILAAGSLVAWYVYATAFPTSEAIRRALRTAFLTGIPAQLAVAAAVIARASAPLRRAAAARSPAADEGAAAVRACRRLPVHASGIVVLASVLTSSAAALAMRAEGMPPDLAVAAAAAGIAAAILSGMLAYSAAASAAAHASAELGAGDVAASGTVRGKILVLGFGLNTIGVLAFAATGYVRYRGDVDREYVAAAARAQASALAAAGDAVGADLARRIWLVTSSPSALVDADGRVRRSFGARDVPFERARGAAAGPLRLEDGWLVTAAAPEGGVVASWLPEAPLWPRRRAFWAELAAAGLAVYAATAMLAWLAARAITLPLRTLGLAADRIAAGDLTAGPPSLSRDEMGELAAQFRRMADGLKALVGDVQAASAGVSAGAHEASAIGEKVRSGAIDEHAGVVAMQAAVGAMEGSVHLVSRGVGDLSEYVSATTHTMGDMAAAFDEVQKKGADLQSAMDAAARDVERLATAGHDAEARLGELEALAGHAGTSLGAVRATISTLERAASESESTAEVVADAAERAGGVVEETVQGIETLRAAVSDAHRRIAALGRRSDDIDQVVDFIGEVAGRTNLLSLNASIIAAQAGEHGKAFAVVADQIRELAAQIARSTKSIGEIIHAVREDVEATAALIDRGDALAVEGVQLARNSFEALGQIRRSTAHGRETAAAIHAAVGAQGGSWREVSQLVESVADGSRAFAGAVQLVGRSVAGVSSVSRSVNAMAEQVARSLEEQAGLGRRQLDGLARLERMIAEITRAVQDHDAATRRVRDALQHLSRTSGEHESAVEGLSGVAEKLGSRARALADSVGRFRV